MVPITAKSSRQYSPLPIDNARGFPQTFPFLFQGQTYYFWLYANIPASRLNDEETFLEIPTEKAFLVVRVERDVSEGNRGTIFLRKVVPEMEYEAEAIALTFPTQKIARQNLNGRGDFGSQVIGGIAKRWA
jgi:hypothetical protein